jgi:hypothetical protein
MRHPLHKYITTVALIPAVFSPWQKPRDRKQEMLEFVATSDWEGEDP